MVRGTLLNRAACTVFALSLATPALSPAIAGSSGPKVPSASFARNEPVDPACKSYGAGFTRVEGTSTCVKVGGFVQMDTYGQGDAGSGSSGSAIAPALRSR